MEIGNSVALRTTSLMWRALAATLGGAALIALAVFVAFTWMIDPVARHASEIDEVDLAIGSAAVTRSATVQAIVFAIDHANGVASAEARDAALSEATANLDAFDTLVDALAGHREPPDMEPLRALAAEGRAIVGLLSAEEIEAARSSSETGFESSYRAGVASLTAARFALLDAVAAASSWSAQLATGVRLAVTIGLPVGLAAAVWLTMRHRLRQYQSQAAEQAQLAEERIRHATEMITAVSHRFRTPLTSIYGLSGVLAQTKRLAGLDKELVSLINAESADLYRIAEDTLAANQLEAGRMQVTPGIVALEEIVDEAVKPVLARGVEVKVDCPPMWVVSDERKLAHVLRNLIANAATHGEEPIFVEAHELDGVVLCSVIDHGPGLEPFAVDAVSDPADRLGLRVAYALAELIGAKLEYIREADRSRFTLWLSEDGPPEGAGEAATTDQIIANIPRPMAAEDPGGDE